MKKGRKVIVTFIAVAFTAAVCALTASMFALSAPPERAYAAEGHVHVYDGLSVTAPKTDYLAYEQFDMTGVEVYLHCTVCGNAELVSNESISVIYQHQEKGYICSGDDHVTLTLKEGVEGQSLSGTVNITVTTAQTAVKWQYLQTLNDGENWVDLENNSLTLDYDSNVGGLKSNFRAVISAGGTVVFRGTNENVVVEKDGTAYGGIIRDAGVYTLSLSADKLNEYNIAADGSNSATIEIMPQKIRLHNEDNFYWFLEAHNTTLRTGYIYVNESDPENNYTYYSTEGENRKFVARSIVRYRNGEELSIKLFGARSKAHDRIGGVYNITYGDGCVASARGKYTAHASLQLTEENKNNYVFVTDDQSREIDPDRYMTVDISADGKSVSITKEWYVAHINNGLRSQYNSNGLKYGDEWHMSDWTYGAYETQCAPRLEHGERGEYGGTIEFDDYADNVIFELYKTEVDPSSGVYRVQIGEQFNRLNFGDYINYSVPAGKYTLVAKVKAITSVDSHTHWYDNSQHTQFAPADFDGFEREFNFTVSAGTFWSHNLDQLKGKSFEYTYDGRLKLFDDTFKLTVTAPDGSDMSVIVCQGIWSNSEYFNKYFDSPQLYYRLARWTTSGAYLSEAELNGYLNHDSTPTNAGEYTVYYKLSALNYEDFGGTDNDCFKVKINRCGVDLPADVTATYDGTPHTYTVADNSPYRVSGTSAYTYAGSYDIVLLLDDPDNNYAWKEADGTLIEDRIAEAKLIIKKAKVSVPEDVNEPLGQFGYGYIEPVGAPFIVVGEAYFNQAGDYTIRVKLTDTHNYEWADADGDTVEFKVHLTEYIPPASGNSDKGKTVGLVLGICIPVVAIGGAAGFIAFRAVRKKKGGTEQ